jgi:hypothetical protein
VSSEGERCKLIYHFKREKRERAKGMKGVDEKKRRSERRRYGK